MVLFLSQIFHKAKWILPVLVITLAGCSPKLHLSGNTPHLYPIKNLPADSSILAYYKSYKAGIDSQMNTVIGVASVNIERGRPEGLLNNLVADVMFQAGNENHIEFDFAHTNYYSLRNPISAGPIKAFKIYELMPFENYFVTVKLKGADILDLFNYMAAGGGDPISGATFCIKDGKASDIMIQGIPFDVSRDYTVLTNDYLANGGDKAVIYTRALKRTESTIKVRDALLNYIKQQQAAGKSINPKLDHRIQTIKL
ncbi:5'-nucleotidase C-terminal domain-containing protein [Arcticibacter eurypsychrophilus]|uniref:5'-nucleotidase C-terminal domain-containing protein n=1 Tax=Arcticibacter eurypsychrophilus TaxID=1434752 RepID=UPI00084D1B53|nr:5'-nucleotidase C-terminal domain-containing protein [Arcticibacter eurypsychrophilus]